MRKTEIPGIVKKSEGVFINTDNEGLKAYKKRKAQTVKLKEIEQDVQDIKSDMREIKELLKGLIK